MIILVFVVLHVNVKTVNNKTRRWTPQQNRQFDNAVVNNEINLAPILNRTRDSIRKKTIDQLR